MKCGSRRIVRSHRASIVDHLVDAVGFVPYRCEACDRRFYSRPQGGGKPKQGGNRRAIQIAVCGTVLVAVLLIVYLVLRQPAAAE